MSLSVIFGKPGAGKSYYAVLRIAEYLEDFCRSELKEGVEHPRKIYTNLPLNLNALDDYVSEKIGKNVSASKYVHLLNEDFFVEKGSSGVIKKKDWWDIIPNGALIVIDEVQHYLSSSKDEGGAYLKDFQLYISTHRHRQHDLIFLTQHTDNINKVCLNMAADAYHVINIKGRVLPFLGIPFADIDVVKEAFGYKQQYANILYGNYVGRAFKPESTLHILLNPKIYGLYKSHNTSEASDRPSLHLSRLGAIFWFLRRHLWHLIIKAAVLFFCVYTMWQVICKLPLHLSDTLQKQMQSKSASTANVPPPVRRSGGAEQSRSRVADASPSSEQIKKPVFPKVESMTPDYVKIDGKRYFKGDEFNYEGRKFVVESINFDRLTVNFGLPIVSSSSSGAEPVDGPAVGQGL